MKRCIAFGSTLIGLVPVGGLLYQALRPKLRRVGLPKHPLRFYDDAELELGKLVVHVGLPKHPLRFYDVTTPRVFSHDEFWPQVFREVLRRAPDRRMAHFYVGMALYHQNKHKEARKELEQYLQKARRRSADPYISRAVQIVTELQNRKPASPR